MTSLTPSSNTATVSDGAAAGTTTNCVIDTETITYNIKVCKETTSQDPNCELCECPAGV